LKSTGGTWDDDFTMAKACEMESFGQKRNAFLIGWWYTYPSEK